MASAGGKESQMLSRTSRNNAAAAKPLALPKYQRTNDITRYYPHFTYLTASTAGFVAFAKRHVIKRMGDWLRMYLVMMHKFASRQCSEWTRLFDYGIHKSQLNALPISFKRPLRIKNYPPSNLFYNLKHASVHHLSAL